MDNKGSIKNMRAFTSLILSLGMIILITFKAITKMICKIA